MDFCETSCFDFWEIGTTKAVNGEKLHHSLCPWQAIHFSGNKENLPNLMPIPPAICLVGPPNIGMFVAHCCSQLPGPVMSTSLILKFCPCQHEEKLRHSLLKNTRKICF
jgi:hypothetical protein